MSGKDRRGGMVRTRTSPPSGMGWACKRAARTSRNANVVDSGAVLVEQPLDRIPCNNRIIEVTLISAVQSHSHEMVVGDLTGFDRRVREQPVTHAHSATRASETERLWITIHLQSTEGHRENALEQSSESQSEAPGVPPQAFEPLARQPGAGMRRVRTSSTDQGISPKDQDQQCAPEYCPDHDAQHDPAHSVEVICPGAHGPPPLARPALLPTS